MADNINIANNTNNINNNSNNIIHNNINIKCISLEKDLPNYTLLHKIGEGSFSSVYKSKHKLTNQYVAIKIIEIIDTENNSNLLNPTNPTNPINTHNNKRLNSIHREIEILKNLSHHNIIKLYEYFHTPQRFYLILEYCSKGELFNYIVEHKRLDKQQIVHFYYQIVQVIEYIHTKGIVHRDLKPENILLMENNTIKIVDFGLSNYYNDNVKGNNSNTNNLLSTICGSPCYAAPEMLLGEKYNGLKIDIWSSGIVLYAMIAGYLPFKNDVVVEVKVENNTNINNINESLYKKIIKGDIYFPNELFNNKEKDLLLKILNVNPKRRYIPRQIMKHEYFKCIENVEDVEIGEFAELGFKINQEIFNMSFNIENENETNVNSIYNSNERICIDDMLNIGNLENLVLSTQENHIKIIEKKEKKNLMDLKGLKDTKNIDIDTDTDMNNKLEQIESIIKKSTNTMNSIIINNTNNTNTNTNNTNTTSRKKIIVNKKSQSNFNINSDSKVKLTSKTFEKNENKENNIDVSNIENLEFKIIKKQMIDNIVIEDQNNEKNNVPNTNQINSTINTINNKIPKSRDIKKLIIKQNNCKANNNRNNDVLRMNNNNDNYTRNNHNKITPKQKLNKNSFNTNTNTNNKPNNNSNTNDKPTTTNTTFLTKTTPITNTYNKISINYHKTNITVINNNLPTTSTTNNRNTHNSTIISTLNTSNTNKTNKSQSSLSNFNSNYKLLSTKMYLKPRITSDSKILYNSSLNTSNISHKTIVNIKSTSQQHTIMNRTLKNGSVNSNSNIINNNNIVLDNVNNILNSGTNLNSSNRKNLNNNNTLKNRSLNSRNFSSNNTNNANTNIIHNNIHNNTKEVKLDLNLQPKSNDYISNNNKVNVNSNSNSNTKNTFNKSTVNNKIVVVNNNHNYNNNNHINNTNNNIKLNKISIEQKHKNMKDQIKNQIKKYSSNTNNFNTTNTSLYNNMDMNMNTNPNININNINVNKMYNFKTKDNIQVVAMKEYEKIFNTKQTCNK